MAFIGIANNIWKGIIATGGGGATWVLNPGTLATLDIDFVNDRAYNSGNFPAIADLLICTRATPSNASYTNADGTISYFAANTLRYGDNGLLVEEQRNNICLQSQDFGTTWVVFDASISTNLVTAPDGTITGDLYTVNVASDYPSVFQSGITVIASATYTFSCMVKAGNTDFFTMESRYNAGDDSAIDAYFQLSGAGSVVAVSAGISANIALLSDGWYRCSIAKTNPGAGTSLLVIISNVSTSIGGASLGNNIYIWGAQVEPGAFATSYIPTTTASVTRAADVVTDNSTFGWYNQSAGSFYCQFTVPDITIDQDFYGVDDTSFNEAIGVYVSGGGSLQHWCRVGGVNQANFQITSPLVLAAKVANAYAINDFAAVMNGETVQVDMSGTLPTPTRLSLSRIGSGVASSNNNKLIKRFAYWNSRLSDSTLQTLTA